MPVIEINFSSLCQIGAGKYFITNERRIYPSKRYLEGNNRAYHSPEPGPTGSSKFHNHFQLIGNNVKPWLNWLAKWTDNSFASSLLRYLVLINWNKVAENAIAEMRTFLYFNLTRKIEGLGFSLWSSGYWVTLKPKKNSFINQNYLQQFQILTNWNSGGWPTSIEKIHLWTFISSWLVLADLIFFAPELMTATTTTTRKMTTTATTTTTMKTPTMTVTVTATIMTTEPKDHNDSSNNNDHFNSSNNCVAIDDDNDVVWRHTN